MVKSKAEALVGHTYLLISLDARTAERGTAATSRLPTCTEALQDKNKASIFVFNDQDGSFYKLAIHIHLQNSFTYESIVENV